MYYYMKLMNYSILKVEWSVYGSMNSEKVCASWALPLNKRAPLGAHKQKKKGLSTFLQKKFNMFNKAKSSP